MEKQEIIEKQKLIEFVYIECFSPVCSGMSREETMNFFNEQLNKTIAQEVERAVKEEREKGNFIIMHHSTDNGESFYSNVTEIIDDYKTAKQILDTFKNKEIKLFKLI